MGANNADFHGQILYHGSKAMLHPGQYITSPAERGKRGNSWSRKTPEYSPNKVFVTSSYDLAQHYAEEDGYVYEVHPVGTLSEDPSLSKLMPNWKIHEADAAKVVRVVKGGDKISGSSGNDGKAYPNASETMPKAPRYPNSFAGKCATCGEKVEAGKGVYVKTGRKAPGAKKYEVYHKEHLND